LSCFERALKYLFCFGRARLQACDNRLIKSGFKTAEGLQAADEAPERACDEPAKGATLQNKIVKQVKTGLKEKPRTGRGFSTIWIYFELNRES
jgi:hypothetical protein